VKGGKGGKGGKKYGRYEIRGNNNCFWFVLGGRSGCSQLWRMGSQIREIWRREGGLVG